MRQGRAKPRVERQKRDGGGAGVRGRGRRAAVYSWDADAGGGSSWGRTGASKRAGWRSVHRKVRAGHSSDWTRDPQQRSASRSPPTCAGVSRSMRPQCCAEGSTRHATRRPGRKSVDFKNLAGGADFVSAARRARRRVSRVAGLGRVRGRLGRGARDQLTSPGGTTVRWTLLPCSLRCLALFGRENGAMCFFEPVLPVEVFNRTRSTGPEARRKGAV